MQPKPRLKVEQDYQIFFVFMTLVMIGTYILSLVQNPSLRQPLTAIVFTTLMIVHIAIHWMVIPIIQVPKRKLLYVLGQGALAFLLTHLSRNTGMVFALYMALIGETIGFLGFNRRGILAAIYYLALSLTNFIIFTNIESAAYWLLTIIPTVIFIGMYVTMYIRQAEAREKAQALADELETANRQLAEYATRVEDLSIANERQRMARELHDTLSQGLAGVILQLEAADAHLSHQRGERARSIVANAMEQARSTLANARRVIDDLRQPSPDDLDSALRLEMDRFTNATGIPCEYHTDHSQPVPDPVKETVLRVVAEALTNVAHHAQAKNVAVNLSAKDKRLLVTVQDDGVGFDAFTIPSGHYGLLGVRERLRLLNGSLEIQNKNGTTLKIEIPL